MNEVEKIESVLADIDIPSVRKTSYIVSVQKFNALSDAYEKIQLYMTFVSWTEKKDEKERSSLKTLLGVPNYYSYEESLKRITKYAKQAAEECSIACGTRRATSMIRDAIASKMKEGYIDMVEYLRKVIKTNSTEESRELLDCILSNADDIRKNIQKEMESEG